MIALAALVCAALFAGAALYVSLVEHPVRMGLDDHAALTEWKPAYARGAPMQIALAVAGGVLGAVAWYRYQSNPWWLAGGLALLANIPYTLLVIWGTNGKLKAIAAEQAGPESRALLVTWGRMHWVRTGLGLVSVALIARGLLP